MQDQAYDEMRRLQDTHWWWRGMRHVYRAALKHHTAKHSRRVVDVGCGFGANLSLLAEQHPEAVVIGVDVSHEALASITPRPGVLLVQAAADALPFRHASFDTVALLAVVEHVERDDVVLSETYRVARPGALQLLLTSAFMLLWSHHDTANGHLRRYRAHQLARLETAAGWRILDLRYLNSLIFPFVALVRIVQRMFPRSQEAKYDMGPNVGFLEHLPRLEAQGWVRLPFGVDLFCVARRDDDPTG